MKKDEVMDYEKYGGKEKFMKRLHEIENFILMCRTCDFEGPVKTLTCIIPGDPRNPYWICPTCQALHMNIVPVDIVFFGAFSGLMSENNLAEWALNQDAGGRENE